MSQPRTPTLIPPAASRDGNVPALPLLFDRIREDLAQKGQMGLLSVTVLQRRSVEHSAGWQAYDAMVREVSGFLAEYRRRRMRSSDGLFEPSLNGNAFVLLLDPPRNRRPLNPIDLGRVRVRLKRGLKEHLASRLPKEVSERFGCYVGVALMRHDPDVQVERLVYRSLEEALADAVRDQQREVRRHAIHLNRILERGLVRSVYQPVVDVIARRVIGYEALTRVPRTRFETTELLFKAAHENDALWNLERLCRRKAIEGAPPLQTDQMLFLNVEPDAIHDPDLLEPGFVERLTTAGLKPSQIVLEMTEHSPVRDFATFRATLHQFRTRGFRLAMDDVGSGHAGLQAIAEIVPDYIKVDMTLIRNIHSNPLKRELIATIHRFTDGAGIILVAEGVESLAELETLIGAGVRCAQGFLFARPSSPPLLPDWDALRF